MGVPPSAGAPRPTGITRQGRLGVGGARRAAEAVAARPGWLLVLPHTPVAIEGLAHIHYI